VKPESILDYTRVKMTVALRKFEAAHAIWMNTSVFSDEMPNVLNKRDDALTEYMVSVHEFEASVKTQQSETVAVREMNRRGELREVPAIEKEEPMKPKQQLHPV
jgi:hypothetical protein